ncbi:sigma factor [Actinomadura oligospora]|uniref:sigma factor n=1 Tax=Actinomadura oligospora TaxID=111804 RepID=UPI000478C3D4|nr:sigma factor [Actinomadura oligospora]
MKLTFSSGGGTDDAAGRHARVRRRGRAEPWPAEPLWPAPDPVRDREILLDLASRRAGAEARLYDAYAARLHDYAASVLREGPAADIVHDVLVDAARRAARVRDRERLGAWLYAATRARIRRRTFPRPRWDWSAAPGGTRPAVPVQVRDALDHLMAVTGPTERELLLLTGRHGLTTDDLEGVLGRPARGLRRRCALAWRHAAEIVAAHTAASAGLDAGLSPSSPPSPFKVSGATPPNGLPYTAADPVRQAIYPAYGTPADERPFVSPGPSRHSSQELDGVLFVPLPTGGFPAGLYETPPGLGLEYEAQSGGPVAPAWRGEEQDGIADPAQRAGGQQGGPADSVVWRRAKQDVAADLTSRLDARRDGSGGPWPGERQNEAVRSGAWSDPQRGGDDQPESWADAGRSRPRAEGARERGFGSGQRAGGWRGEGERGLPGGVAGGGVGGPVLRVEALLVAPVVPPPPQRLRMRMRVLHTLADPELAPYRAEIRARGGRLTPEGLPRQPDATSPVARRTRRASLRTTLTGAAAVTGVRTSAAATATVGTALVPLFLVPASTPTTGLGLAPGGHGGHSIASPLNGDLPEPLPDRPAHDSGVDVPFPTDGLPAVPLSSPEGDSTAVISGTPKYPDAPAISGGVPSGIVLPDRPSTPPGSEPLPVPFAPPDLSPAVPQVVRDVVQALPQVVQTLPRVVQDVPEIVRDVPRTIADVPGTLRDVSKVVEDVPKTLQDVPHVVQDVPHVVRDVPKALQDVPAVVRDLPAAISGVTGTASPSARTGGLDVSDGAGGGQR